MSLLTAHQPSHPGHPLDHTPGHPLAPVTPPAATDRLRVLVVTESFLPAVNGVTNSVRRVLEHLAEEGHVAELVAPSGPATYAGFPVTQAFSTALPWYPSFRLGLETRRRLRQVMARFRPDVVHIASPATLGHQAALAAAQMGIPSVAIYQTDMVSFADRYVKGAGGRAMAALTRRIHTRVDRTLAPSTASLAQLEALDVPETYRWPRGVDAVSFHPGHRDAAWRRELAPDGRALVGYVGRLASEKELDLLVGLHADPRVRLVIVGGGPDEERLRGLLPDARFLGVLHGADLSRAHASLDVFVHTGRHETYCQSAQEALASGVPVVAPRQGGPVDVVPDGVGGYLFTPGDADELAAHVGRLLDDPGLRARLGAQARRAVEGRTWRAVNEALVGHYRAVVTARAAAERRVRAAA
ncbi:glycosyltransferase family 1 protein [Nocardioides sp. GY 10127]|uniref:glycosyltransferase family 4 protein n=1 Tax=Nocardioides sp. GY 10127 TaxID=2569762 RepID=UPI0010A803D7|nr:glycosyltransferase family 1 protein [Nocardioides sp. GY 10127]TIC80865.1 glycosyltransferase family 1 protein [Nocardioides sp. GY 10127]